MIIETASSIYEVHEREQRFRRIHESKLPAYRLPVGRWYKFERMGPLEIGEPARFFWLLDEEGDVSRIGLWATSPVIGIIPDDEPSYLVPHRGAAAPA